MKKYEIKPDVSVDGVSLSVCYGEKCKESEDYLRLQEFKESIKSKDFSGHIKKSAKGSFTRVTVKLPTGTRLGIRYGYTRGKHWGYYHFNPSKLESKDWPILGAYFDLLFSGGFQELAGKGGLYRYDIALDYKNVSFDQCIFIDRKLTAGRGEFIPKGTAYLGHERGRRRFCCYDKRREREQKKKSISSDDLLRIELRLRDPSNLSLSDVPGNIPNPFASLAVIDWNLLFLSKDSECQSLAKDVVQGQPPDYAFSQSTAHQKKHAWGCLKSCFADWWDADMAWQAVKTVEPWQQHLQ